MESSETGGSPSLVCANGHEMSLGQSFCSTCGSPTHSDTLRMCPNGHEAEEDAIYCAECGQPVAVQESPLPPGPSFQTNRAGVFERLKQRYSRENFRNFLKPSGILIDHKPKQPRPPKQTLLGAPKQRHPKRWIIGAVVGLALVAELVATNGHGWESSWWGTRKSTSTQAVPLDVCGQNLINWLNYSSGHSLYVIETFGEQSGIPTWIFNEAGVFQQQATEHGEAAANNKVEADIAQECVSLAEHGTHISNLPTPPKKGQ